MRRLSKTSERCLRVLFSNVLQLVDMSVRGMTGLVFGMPMSVEGLLFHIRKVGRYLESAILIQLIC